jgi:hypothetical protein
VKEGVACRKQQPGNPLKDLMTNKEEGESKDLECWKIPKKAKGGKRYTFASEAIASIFDDDTTWLSNC